MSRALDILTGGLPDIDEAMLSMTEAFPPAYGEAWTRAQLAGVFSLPAVVLLLARIAGEPAGFALLRTVMDEAELLLLAVRPDRRRLGVGRGLLAESGAAAARAGAERLHLEVRDGNPAHLLYSSAGLVEVGRRRGYYRTAGGAALDAVTLSRTLPLRRAD